MSIKIFSLIPSYPHDGLPARIQLTSYGRDTLLFLFKMAVRNYNSVLNIINLIYRHFVYPCPKTNLFGQRK